MNTYVISIVGELDKLGCSPQERGQLLSLAIARAVAYRLPLPASSVGNPFKYFNDTHRTYAETLVCELNERVILDVDATVGVIGRLWELRYSLVHDADNFAVRNFLDALVKFGAREIPSGVSELMIRFQKSDALDNLARALGLQLPEPPAAPAEAVEPAAPAAEPAAAEPAPTEGEGNAA